MDGYAPLIVNILLFLSISTVLVIYIKKIWGANREYTKAKTIVEEVVLSFNREIQSLKQKIGEIDEKIQNIQLPDADQIRSELRDLTTKTENLQSLYSALEKKFESIKMNVDKLSEMANRQERKIKMQEELTFSAKPAIPLKRERALASLTPTELKVLEILFIEGDKTVREIKNRIGLTREHTGRLMKSLYEKGYVERRKNKIPYIYRIKKEMENILSNQISKS